MDMTNLKYDLPRPGRSNKRAEHTQHVVEQEAWMPLVGIGGQEPTGAFPVCERALRDPGEQLDLVVGQRHTELGADAEQPLLALLSVFLFEELERPYVDLGAHGFLLHLYVTTFPLRTWT